MSSAPGEASAFYRLAALGAALTALTLLTPFAFKTWGDSAYVALTIPAGLIALVATRVAEHSRMARALYLIVGIAVTLRIVLLLLDPLLSTDIYRYVWDGKVQAAGVNPYRYVPADPALAFLRDAAIYPNINRADYARTIYPPIAELFFLTVTRLGENVTTMRLSFLGCEAVAVIMVALLLRQLGRPVTRIVAWLWHPLPMWEIANSGHIDALMLALMITGIWLALTAWPLRGAVAIALAALAKPFALLALPALWRPWDWRMPAIVVAMLALCYVPYASVGAGAFGFLTSGYFDEEGLAVGDNWPLTVWQIMFGVHRYDTAVYLALSLLVLGVLSLKAAFRRERTPDSMLADINRLLLVFLLLLSPRYPWYFLAIVPFVVLCGSATGWAASIGALLLQEEIDWGPDFSMFARKTALYGGIVVVFIWSTWLKQSTERQR